MGCRAWCGIGHDDHVHPRMRLRSARTGLVGNPPTPTVLPELLHFPADHLAEGRSPREGHTEIAGRSANPSTGLGGGISRRAQPGDSPWPGAGCQIAGTSPTLWRVSGRAECRPGRADPDPVRERA